MQDRTDIRNAEPAAPSMVQTLLAGLDLFATILVLVAVLFGFVGGWCHRDVGFGLMIASAELLIIGILAGLS